MGITLTDENAQQESFLWKRHGWCGLRRDRKRVAGDHEAHKDEQQSRHVAHHNVGEAKTDLPAAKEGAEGIPERNEQ